MLKRLQFLNPCRRYQSYKTAKICINNIPYWNAHSYNGRQLILQTEQITAGYIIVEKQYSKPYYTSSDAQD